MRITSESVLEGHPDKICDQISDAILDEYLKLDRGAHVAIETFISNRLLVVAGEVRSIAKIDIESIANHVLASIGYDDYEKGFDYQDYTFVKNIHEQSRDIAQGVDEALESNSNKDDKWQGAGDQGMMYGYACDETKDFMPLPITIAHSLSKQLTKVRKEGVLSYLYPDGKTQITVDYDEMGNPIKVTDIVVSAQHNNQISQEQLSRDILKHVINPVLTSYNLEDSQPRIFINPTGRFVIGGPKGDTGLTGRKIIVDTYGGIVPHGGGAFSGKDPSKVDRSAAYMARYVAKNIVAAGLAKRCQIALSYAIGVSKPVSITINTFGTETVDKQYLQPLVECVFDFTPRGIIDKLDLCQPIYQDTARYGHFKSGSNLPWEEIDQAELLKRVASALVK